MILSLAFSLRSNARSMYSRDAEFHAWLVDHKRLDPGIISPRDLKEYFAEFAEDWNTCTLHEKYYDLTAWEKSRGLGQDVMQGGSGAGPGGVDLMADEEALRIRSKGRNTGGGMPSMNVEQLKELKKVYEERTIADRMRKQGLKVNEEKMGVRYEKRLLD
jgi:hypothetical protein